MHRRFLTSLPLHPLAFANLWGPVRCYFCGFWRGRCLRIGPSGFDRAIVVRVRVRGVVVGGVVVRERVVVLLEVGVARDAGHVPCRVGGLRVCESSWGTSSPPSSRRSGRSDLCAASARPCPSFEAIEATRLPAITPGPCTRAAAGRRPLGCRHYACKLHANSHTTTPPRAPPLSKRRSPRDRSR